MTLEHKFEEQRTVVVRRTPNPNIADAINSGNKFIIVTDTFLNSEIPLGYMLIDMRYKGESFKTLVPQRLLYYIANPGEGSIDDALDELGDFYDEVEKFEDDLLEQNESSVQGTNWAVSTRNTYQVYLINKLTKGKQGDADTAEFNPETIKDLDIEDDFVSQRIKAIAAVALGKTADQVRKSDIKDVLRHVTVNERRVEALTVEEFAKITCWAGSHYEIKEEYRNDPNVHYEVDKMHDMNHKVGKKITHKQEVAVLDAKIGDLEKEIYVHRRQKKEQKGSHVGRHDSNLLRMYINLTYIAKEDPQKQLEIKPEGVEE